MKETEELWLEGGCMRDVFTDDYVESLRQQLVECEAKVKWMEGNTPNWGWPWDAPFTDGYETAKDEFRERIVEVEQRLAECELERDDRASPEMTMMLKATLAAVTKERDEVINWVCHNGGLLNEWAKEWKPEKHHPLTTFIRDRLIAALAKVGADKTGEA